MIILNLVNWEHMDLTFRTQFNGFYSNEIYEVEDNPIMTMYDKEINKAISGCLMSEKKILGHNSKKDFLKKPVEHIDITSFDSRKIISINGKNVFCFKRNSKCSKYL